MRALCGQCGNTVDLPESEAGKSVVCPQCQHEIAVPRLNAPAADAGDEQIYAAEEEEGFASYARNAVSRRVHVTCGSCRKMLSVGARLSGKKARCPSCGNIILIPYPEEDIDLPLGDGSPEEEERLNLLAGAVAEQAAAPTKPGGLDNLDLGAEQEIPWPAPPTESDKEAAVEHLAAAAAPVAPPTLAEIKEAVAEGGKKAPEPPAEEKPAKKRRGLVVVLIAAVVVIGVGALVVDKFLQPGKPPVVPKPTPVATTAASAPVTAGIEPTPEPTTTPVPVVQTPPLKPPEPPITIQVGEPGFAYFTPDGYFPAPAGSVYLELAATLKSRDGFAAFETQGKGVKLVSGEAAYACLGKPAAKTRVPALSFNEKVTVGPRDTKVIAMLFQVPQDFREGKLVIEGVGEAAVGPLTPAPPPEEKDLPGTYGETEPRNLRPLLRDPVMAALQSAGPAELVISRASGEIRVEIAAAGVTGTLTSAGGGLYDAALKAGGDSLACKLRVLPGGKIVLYLSPEPFHQLTYARK